IQGLVIQGGCEYTGAAPKNDAWGYAGGNATVGAVVYAGGAAYVNRGAVATGVTATGRAGTIVPGRTTRCSRGSALRVSIKYRSSSIACLLSGSVLHVARVTPIPDRCAGGLRAARPTRV